MRTLLSVNVKKEKTQVHCCSFTVSFRCCIQGIVRPCTIECIGIILRTVNGLLTIVGRHPFGDKVFSIMVFQLFSSPLNCVVIIIYFLRDTDILIIIGSIYYV